MAYSLMHFSDIRGVIFDWDGVIADTRLDFSPIRDKYFDGRRTPLLEAAETMPELRRSAYLREIRNIEVAGATNSTPVEGAFGLIDLLNRRGLPWCILTRNCMESLLLAARTIKFPLPEHVFSRESKHMKPDPRAMYDAANAIGIAPQQCLVVGDYLYELIGARRAGMRCVLVRSSDRECAALADAIYPTLPSLEQAFINNDSFVPWEQHEDTCLVKHLIYNACSTKQSSGEEQI